MKKFNRGDKFGGRDSRSRDRDAKPFERRSSGRSEGRFNDRDSRGPRSSSVEMFDATCDSCGKRCQVPFKPTGSKPIYCRDCFRKNEDSAPRERFQDRNEPRRDSGSSPELKEINRKLDKILRALEIE